MPHERSPWMSTSSLIAGRAGVVASVCAGTLDMFGMFAGTVVNVLVDAPSDGLTATLNGGCTGLF
jgi:hypothetical protein